MRREGPIRRTGRTEKTFQTALGEIRLSRAYYHCLVCTAGFHPRDHALGMAHTSLSPALTRMIGLTAARVSFAEAGELLHELGGVRVNPKQVERTAEALGREISTDEKQVIEPLWDQEVPPTLYLGVDGTGIPMRGQELKGRPGKQPDGTAKTREVKLITMWSAQARDKEGRPVRDEGSVTYSAAIESAAQRDVDALPSEFARRVLREAQRRGFERAAKQVVLGDGAPWIWNLATEHFPHATQIVDRFHAKEKLHTIAKDIYGYKSDLWRPWAKQRCEELDAADIEALLKALRPFSKKSDEARKGIGYFSENRRRMNYPRFEAEGLCTASGVVEAGCKTAIAVRLKRAGMHWTLHGANAIIALRCCCLSGRFEDFWERRAESQGFKT